MEKARNYGIDLLRLVLMFMVCILHTLGRGGILSATTAGTLEYNTYWLMEILSYCAVNAFALISGYMASDKPRKYDKLVDMWFQAFFYTFILTAIFSICGLAEGWKGDEIIRCAFPVTFGRVWYFTAFFGLYFIIPVLNKFIFSIDEATAKKAFIILIFLFSILGFLVYYTTGVYNDIFKTDAGKTLIWLIILYLIGALAKRIRLFEKRKTITLIIMWLISILITWVMLIFNIGSLVNYISPTMLFSGLLMVVLFSRIRLKGTIISKLSPLAFGIYLFQLNFYIWRKVINNTFTFVASENIFIGVLYVLAIALSIFVAGLIVEFVRSQLAKLVHLSSLSKLIVSLIDKLLTKASALLK